MENDAPYTFGRPVATYIGGARDHARLLVLRCRPAIEARRLYNAGLAPTAAPRGWDQTATGPTDAPQNPPSDDFGTLPF